METNVLPDVLLNQVLPVPTFADTSAFLTEESFYTNGFMVVPNVLSAEEIENLKLVCDNYLASTHSSESEVPSSDFLKDQDLSNVVFNDKVIEVTKKILGDGYTIYPNFVARLNRFTKWHIDNGFHSKYIPGDSSYLHKPTFRHAQCAIYLQENSDAGGGGLDVVPGTHLNEIPMDNKDKNDISLKTLMKVTANAISLKTNAGDLILFDGRLLHRGTQPKGLSAKKYGIFWSTAKSDQVQVQSYLGYLSKRSEFLSGNGQSKDFMVARYSDIHNIRFPESFLPSIAEKISRNGLSIATLDQLQG
jgi:hypothetical protein